MELYFIPREEANQYNITVAHCGLRVSYDPIAKLWDGTVGAHFPRPPLFTPADQIMLIDFWERVRVDMVAGRLACFRVNEDGSPFQAPTSVTRSRIDIPCHQCGRPNDPGYKKCWWCTCAPMALLLAVCLTGLVSCAHVQPKKVVALHVGVRPAEQQCTPTPVTYEGICWRFSETCMYLDGGAAACQYLCQAGLGRLWACSVSLGQAECKDPWEARAMNCVPWTDGYEILLKDLQRGDVK
jgi:hypothetical protein